MLVSATAYHPEDIRSALRKRHGTVAAFARARSLKPQALADWLRGRTSAAVAAIVADELGEAEIQVAERQSMGMDDSDAEPAAHRLNAGAR